MKRIPFALLFTLFGTVLGLLIAPTVRGIDDRSTQIQNAQAKGFMWGLACSKKSKREWPLEGRSPCQ